MTLEDEKGFVNVVLWEQVMQRFSILAKTATLLGITGKIQSQDGVVHLIAESLWEPRFKAREDPIDGDKRSRDFH